ncbi:peroxisomal 2,4-dienoyl-CoA reductase [(3E)-enoyl-CoA-producing]-like [Halichondria panicea]|uniref:peroxisomal 2,4-dienoyl-CoA reductase [(3E)-enoyl-CoA-producing]-like n=1 Tax=Halichondria panicea TaxID=6063 RepID=UPI00312B3329
MAQKDPNHDDYCLEQYKHQFQVDLLQGRVAFITGGGSGIGFRMAELLMRHGCHVAIGSRRRDKLQESAQRLSAATGRECLPIQMDVRKYDSVKNAVEETLQKFKRIDILINSAAGNFLCPAASLSSNAFRTVIEIDTVGCYNASRAVYDAYFKDNGGCIINISATLHYLGQPLQVHAGSAKAAIDAMTRHLAVEWGPNNIRVNCIAPGPIEGTVGMRKLGGLMLEGSPEVKDKMMSYIPLGRMGTRTEIAESAVFLASDLSSYITGAVLVVDGGAWLGGGGGPMKSML